MLGMVCPCCDLMTSSPFGWQVTTSVVHHYQLVLVVARVPSLHYHPPQIQGLMVRCSRTGTAGRHSAELSRGITNGFWCALAPASGGH